MTERADAAKLRHMTAFTYRFVPAMRMRHLVTKATSDRPGTSAYSVSRIGTAARWVAAAVSEAGTGEVGDMLSHRIDYGHSLIGPIVRVAAQTKRVWDSRVAADGREYPSDLEDRWDALRRSKAAPLGVLESTQRNRHGSAAKADGAGTTAKSTAPRARSSSSSPSPIVYGLATRVRAARRDPRTARLF